MMRTIWIAEEKRRAERQAIEASHLVASREEEEELEDDYLGREPPTTAQSKGSNPPSYEY